MRQEIPTQCMLCGAEKSACRCGGCQPLETVRHVLILQHPQEPNAPLGTAFLLHQSLPNSTLRIGLSWRNLVKALGREASASRWTVLYLGSGVKDANFKAAPGLTFVNRKGQPKTSDPAAIEGLVVLDGTWSQAKGLWWKNPWLLKLRRVILTPKEPSRYGKQRQEPRAECVSTLEATAEALTALGESPEIEATLKARFTTFLKRSAQ